MPIEISNFSPIICQLCCLNHSLSQAVNTLYFPHPLRVSFLPHSLILLDGPLSFLGKLFIAWSNLMDSRQKASHLFLDCCDKKSPPDLPNNQSQLIVRALVRSPILLHLEPKSALMCSMYSLGPWYLSDNMGVLVSRPGDHSVGFQTCLGCPKNLRP